jgi:hypothetical protein
MTTEHEKQTTLDNKLTDSVMPECVGSSLCSQQPTTGPYPQPGESTPHPPIYT